MDFSYDVSILLRRSNGEQNTRQDLISLQVFLYPYTSLFFSFSRDLYRHREEDLFSSYVLH